MPAQRRLFMPADSLQIRDPLTNEKRHGNIMNPPRYMEIGGMTSANKRGLEASGSHMDMKSPESTQRRVPVK
jgi:hypothetical protein